MSRLLERLKNNARLQREWDRWELGGPAPEALHHKTTASMIEEAAARITELETTLAGASAVIDDIGHQITPENIDALITCGKNLRAALSGK